MNPPSPETCLGAARPADPLPSAALARGRVFHLSMGALAPGRLVPATGRLVQRSWRPLVQPQLRRSTLPGRQVLLLVLFVILVAGLSLIGWELHTSKLQARYFSRRAARLGWTMESHRSAVVLRAPQGPYDRRHGYARLPEMQARLESNSFRVARQASPSPELQALVARGIAPPYHEKNDAGLQIQDSAGRPLFDARRTQTLFREFVDIPPVLVQSLLFVEDRKLLDSGRPQMNPALEWDRLLLSGWRYALDHVFDTGNTSGGSTLATQVQKFRHSPGGRTAGVGDKGRQMLGATYAAYRDGESTWKARQRIVLDYINGLPLGAAPDVGEVTGLGEGLRVWFDESLEQLLVDLSLPEDGPTLARKARSYEQALALLLATRRPASYLGATHAALEQRLDFYLDELAAAGIISPKLAAAARAQPLELRDRGAPHGNIRFVDRKAANAIRTDLLELLDVRGFYDLDHLDLRVETTLDLAAQARVLARLQQLRDPKYLAQNGFYGKHLLGDGDPTQVVYTFSLYSAAPEGNRLLVHADNLDQPLDLNDMAKLELGSTAKLRTIANYLMVMAELYDKLRARPQQALWERAAAAPDPLTRWAADWLARHPQAALGELLDASLERPFSTDPQAQFFTGGGLHTFVNFDDEIQGDLPLRLGFRHSVNLVFIRLMRELVSYYTVVAGYDEPAILNDREHPARQTLLRQAVQREATQHLLTAYQKYKDVDAEEAVRRLCNGNERTLDRFAVFYLSTHTEATPEELARAAAKLFPEHADAAASAAPRLVRGYGGRRLTLSDQGWLMKRDPFEIWLVRERQAAPEAAFAALAARMETVRDDAYAWLYAKGAWRTQNIRLRTELEHQAFERIHAAWSALGYPFGSLVPSLATAIGSSADRPAALAELVGIVQNDGLRAPTQRIKALHFGSETPYETDFVDAPRATVRVMPKEVARELKALLQDAVENGTAIRASGAAHDRNGERLVLGGKTGSGDNRYETFAADGTLLTSRAVSRTASFVFYIGKQHFGVITAHVAGPTAGDYSFTSSLALQAFKILATDIEPLLGGDSRHAGAGGSTRHAHVAP